VAFELLCRLGIYQAHENLAPHRAGLERSFSKDVLAEVESVAASPLSLEGRRDMTHLTTVSIDDPHTSEIDDAFALDGNRLHVFIADVAHFVPTGGQLDEEASERMSTVYLPEGKIPMLPGAIGQELASLNRGEVRPVLCFSGTIDARGGFSDFELCEALCSVDHRLDYASVDLWLSEGGGEPSVMPALRALDTWSEAHLDRRLEAGAMVFQRKEIHTTIDVDGRVHLHQPNANGSSRLLIAEMMVAICFKAARYLRDNRLPAIYRGQAPPDVEIDATRLDLSNPVVEYELLRKVKPSTLSLHPRPHAALGASCYAQITSPIRRYADLLLHRQLKSHLRGVTAPYDVEALGGYLADIEQKQGIIRRVERDSNRYWLLRYLEQNPGQELEAIVLRRLRRRWLVNLPALCIPATLLARGRLHPGQLLRVRVTDVDACRDVLVLDEV
jgi:exoribonuclease-2